MKYQQIIFAFILLFCSLESIGQNNSKFIPDTKFIKGTQDSLLISTRPVTNREYIIYLLWLNNVDGLDYPEVFYNAVPGLSQTELDKYLYESNYSANTFDAILKCSKPYLMNYFFNPKYIDYPVVGVSWLQASRYCKWLSDRFNEYKLIRDGYFMPDPMQSNEECFVTESYLADQYFGIRNKAKENVTLKWNDRLLTPAFRLPTAREIGVATRQNILETGFKSYAFQSSNFLKQWNDWDIEATETKLILKNPATGWSYEINTPNENWDINKYDYKELPFDINYINDTLNIFGIFEKHNQILMNVKEISTAEKDSLGVMPYIIFDENKKKEPIAVGRFNRTDLVTVDTSKLYFFRYAGAIKPKQYKF